MNFYKLTSNELKNELETDFESGLSNEEAEHRINKDGINFLSRLDKSLDISSFYRVLALLATGSFIFIAAFLIYKNKAFIADFVLIALLSVLSLSFIYILYFFCIKKISHISFDDFKTLNVLRNGKIHEISYKNITYGDVVILKKGDYIPFDARILDSDSFEVDETTVSGKTHALKFASDLTADNLDVSCQTNMAFCSSVVRKGSAKVVVTDISNRVYLKKSLKLTTEKASIAVKATDFSKVLFLLLLCFCVLSLVVCSIITKDIIALLSCSLILVAVFTSNFFSLYTRYVFNYFYYKLYNKKIYLKSISGIDNLNNVNVLLLKHNAVSDKNAKISGFINEQGEYRLLSEINKSNFTAFLYSSFCNESACEGSQFYSFKKLSLRVLKSVGIDFSQVRTMCPVVSHYSDANSGYDISGIVYDGSNVLIARGEFKSIIKLCADDEIVKYQEALDKLNRNSTEIIAVAVKQVSMIEDDLSEQNDNFKLMGFIGLTHQISKASIKVINNLSKSAVKSVILFPGNELSALQFASSTELTATSYRSFKADDNKLKITDYDIIFDFDGNISDAVQLCLKSNLNPIYNGPKYDNNVKTVSVESCSQANFHSKFTDLFCQAPDKGIYEAILSAKAVFSHVRDMLLNIICFSLLYSLGGIMFTAINKSLLYTPLNLAYTLLFAIPFVGFTGLIFKRESGFENSREFAKNPLHLQSVWFCGFPVIIFLLMIIILKFTAPAQFAIGFITVAFEAFLPAPIFFIKKNILQRLSYFVVGVIPAVISVVVLSLPFVISGYAAQTNAALGVLAIICGTSVKYLSVFLSKSLAK